MTDEQSHSAPTLNEAAVRDLLELIHLIASARDAMTDAMVVRLARTVSEGVALLDRLTRNEGVMRLLQVLDRQETQYLLVSLATSIEQMSRDLANVPPAKGGIGGLWQLMREPGTQEAIRALALLGRHWNDSLRELHRRGGA